MKSSNSSPNAGRDLPLSLKHRAVLRTHANAAPSLGLAWLPDENRGPPSRPLPNSPTATSDLLPGDRDSSDAEFPPPGAEFHLLEATAELLPGGDMAPSCTCRPPRPVLQRRPAALAELLPGADRVAWSGLQTSFPPSTRPSSLLSKGCECLRGPGGTCSAHQQQGAATSASRVWRPTAFAPWTSSACSALPPEERRSETDHAFVADGACSAAGPSKRTREECEP